MRKIIDSTRSGAGVHREHDIKRKDKRPCLIVHRANDDYDIMPWAEVLDVRRTEGEGGKNAFLQSSLSPNSLLK